MRKVAIAGLKVLGVVAIAVAVHFLIEPLRRDPRYRPLTRLEQLRHEQTILELQLRSREVWDETRDVSLELWKMTHPIAAGATAEEQKTYMDAFERAERAEGRPRPADGGSDEELRKRLTSIRQQIAEAETGGS